MLQRLGLFGKEVLLRLIDLTLEKKKLTTDLEKCVYSLIRSANFHSGHHGPRGQLKKMSVNFRGLIDMTMAWHFAQLK